MKDYYSILEITVTATPAEIKQAYRRLAKIYHPDIQSEDPYALTRFNEIKEAYETLLHPQKKERYLQERWLQKANGRFSTDAMVTPPNILRQVLELNKRVLQQDVHRMSFSGVLQQVRNVLTPTTMEQLIQFNEPDINQKIIASVTDIARILPPATAAELCAWINPLVQQDAISAKQVQQLLQTIQKKHRLRRLTPWLMIGLMLLLCLLIYLSAVT